MKPDMTPRTPRRPLVWPDGVFDLRDEAGLEDETVYIVGGAVRDAAFGLPIHDLDLTTPSNPIKIARRIADAFNGDVYVMDAERGVARAMIDRPDGHYVIDVTAFRGPDLLADLADRDFTLNAMAVDLHSELSQVIDPLGGETDLFDKVIRRCSPLALADDPLRALRAIRQSTKLNARIEPETLADIRAVVPYLVDVSAERVRDEFFKILHLNRASTALRIAERLGLLDYILPELIPLRDIIRQDESLWDTTLYAVEKLHGILSIISPRRTDATAAVFDFGMVVMALDKFRQELHQHIEVIWPDERTHKALLCLSVLLHRTAQPHTELDLSVMVEERARSLRLSVDEIRRLKLIAVHHAAPLQVGTDDLSVHRYWQAYGETGVDLCLVAMAVYLAEQGRYIDQDAWIALLERLRVVLYAYYVRYEEVVAPPPLLDGDRLMQALSLKPGKQIGDLLTLIREGQVTGEIRTLDDALALARAKINPSI